MNLAQSAAITTLGALFPLLNGGTGVIYSGTMPATPETTATGTALVTATFAATALSGSITYVSPDVQGSLAFSSTSLSPSASGTAGYMRLYESGGTIAVADLTVGTTGTDVILGTTTISTGTTVNITSAVLKLPAV
ncbi:MAG: hypothetical protein PHZ23_15920 [Acidiphilium sp.]|nr:hypothetical protein [Acidiphilium sp.]